MPYKTKRNVTEGISKERLREIIREELLAIREDTWKTSADGISKCDYNNTGPG